MFLNQRQIDAISLISPNSKVSFIRDYKVEKKIVLDVPEKISEILPCPNTTCISNKEREPIVPEFTRITENPLKIQCDYCGRLIMKEEIFKLIEKLAGENLRKINAPIVESD